MESFRCSIEMEPRTLSPRVMSNARVEAFEIFLNRGDEEASLIFNEGKKDGSSVGEGEREKSAEFIELNSTTSKGLEYVRKARQPLSSPF